MKILVIFLTLALGISVQEGNVERVSIPLDLKYTITGTNDYNTSSDKIQIMCMALAVYGEVGNVAVFDQDIIVVANVIMNRVGHKMFRNPATTCSVVTQRNQFEPLERFKGLRYTIAQVMNGQNIVLPKGIDQDRWERVYNLSKMVYNGHIPDTTNGAIGFYAPKAQSKLNRRAPYWTKKLELVVSIGGHNFYR